MPETDNVIDLRKVDKVYSNGYDVQVLFGVDLQVEQGSFNSLVGQSGSGKSTLLNIIGTLDRATGGEVWIAGRRTDQMTRNQLAELRNETIGFIFQFHHLLPEFTARENVLMPWLIKEGKAPKEIQDRADELLEMVGISEVGDNLATKMSGGQQQRAAIARALITRPRLVLADEPTGNLDSETTERIYRLMRQLNEELDTTFLIVTHDRKVAEQTDRIIEIRDGRIVLDVKKG
jgi:lipoprotein-releasing system ATP-binding protein